MDTFLHMKSSINFGKTCHVSSLTISIWIILLLSLIIISSGCTVAGFAIGTVRDNRKPSESYSITNHELDKIKQGNLVEIHAIVGRVINGTYLGVDTYEYDSSLELISLKYGREILKIRTFEIEKIHVLKQKKNDKWIMGAVGAAFDVILYFLFIKDFTLFEFGPR